jgi:hypothetical protein
VKDVTGGVSCLQLSSGKQLYYRAILAVNPVNFSLMSEDDQDALIEGFKSFLNGFSFPIQILVRNLPYSLDSYIQKMEAVQDDLAEMARDHADFLRQLASKRALVKRFFYIIVPADDMLPTVDRQEALLNAQTQLNLRTAEMHRQLERLGLTGYRLDDKEILSLYQSCYLSEEARQWPLSDSLIEGTNRLMVSAREQVHGSRDVDMRGMQDSDEDEARGKQKPKDKKAAKKKQKIPNFASTAELIAPTGIEAYPWYLRIDGEAGQEYVRTLAFVNYPRSAYPGWLDALIRLDEPFVDFSIHIAPLSPEQVNTHLGRKVNEFRGSVLASARQGKSPTPTTAIALGDMEGLRDKLARGDERVFNISVFVQVRGRSRRELSERNNRLVSAIRSLDFRSFPVHWQHHAGLLSCLPECDNQLGRGRLFGTSSAATFYPFIGNDIGMETGVLFGVDPGGSLIILNPFNSDVLENANLVVFAKSGAGKSFFLKTTTSRLLPTCNVYVIDPEAEYNNLCKNVRGQYVRLSSTSLQLNPFELYTVDDAQAVMDEDREEQSNFFREKLLNLVTLFELLLGDNGVLSQREKAFLHRCLLKTYANRGMTNDPTTHHGTSPNMQEFYLVLTSVKREDYRFGVEEDVFGLSERLERYLHIFPNRTRVELDNRFVDFNIRELNDSLKPIGLFLITEFLWTKMRQARQARTLQPNTIVLIDEAWLIMQFSQGAKFLAEFARRIRKYGGGLWCTTQNSEDFLGSEEGRTILSMATMKFLMKQDSSTIEAVARTFRLSRGQRNFLLAVKRGEGLFSTKSWTPMEVVASKKEQEIANTTVGAFINQEQTDEIAEPLQLDAGSTGILPSVNGQTVTRLIPSTTGTPGKSIPSNHTWKSE